MSRQGVLLVNVGTPDSPQPKDVRRYLREFLSDPRVVDIPAIPRWLLLNLIILPLRPKRSAEAYEKVWTPEGSPLLVESESFREALAEALGDSYSVRLAMRYGRPSMAGALDSFRQEGVERILLFPLYPQFAEATTGTTNAHAEALSGTEMPSIPAFYDDARVIEAWVGSIRPHWETKGSDHLLLSYHGLPERQVQRIDAPGFECPLTEGKPCPKVGESNRDCYRAQCFATSELIREGLGLAPERVTTSFQSRLGRTPWIRPYTDEVLPRLYQRGVRSLMVATPSFTTDCLETLEEIGMGEAERWKELGGESFDLIPCLNKDPHWVAAAAQLVRDACS